MAGIRTKGKYQVIWSKGRKKTPDFGSLADIQAGDLISWNDNGVQTAIVEKIIGTKWSRRFKTVPVVYHRHVIKKSQVIEAKNVGESLRLLPGEKSKKLEDVLDGK